MTELVETTRKSAGTFSIEQNRFDQVVEQSGKSQDAVESVLLYGDWDNADDHQVWLDEAPISEIVSWVIELAEIMSLS